MCVCVCIIFSKHEKTNNYEFGNQSCESKMIEMF